MDQPTNTPQPRRLHRSSTDRVIGGVAGGLGRYFDVDPVVFRITLAALSFVGGIGLLIYLLALAFVPGEGEQARPFDRQRLLTLAGLALLGIAVLATFGGGPDGGWLFALALLGGVGYAVFRAVRGGSVEVTFKRVVQWVAIGTGTVLGALALAAGAAWAAAEGSGAVVAGIVIAIGVLLVGAAAFGPRARWLAVPALVIAIPLGVVAAADVSFDGGFGEREYRPATLADIPRDGYRLGAGDMRVDLTDVDFPAGSTTVLPLRLGAGYAEVVVPPDVCASTDSRLGGGYFNLRGREAAGLDVDYLVQGGGDSAPRLLIRADVGLGAVEVVDRPRLEERGFDRRPIVRTDGGCSRVEIASAG
jgi:phage shock protein PspC (stress-responsive transcriptional regulator)